MVSIVLLLLVSLWVSLRRFLLWLERWLLIMFGIIVMRNVGCLIICSGNCVFCIVLVWCVLLFCWLLE